MLKNNNCQIQAKFTKYLDNALHYKRSNYLTSSKKSKKITYTDEIETALVDVVIEDIEDKNVFENLNLLDTINNELLFNALSKLAPKDYEILNLRFINNKTFYEISIITNSDISKVRNTYYNTLKKLKKILETV